MRRGSRSRSGGLDGRPLLVVIDMQLIFAAGATWATPGFEALEVPIGRLVRAFGSRVSFTRFRVAGRPTGSWKRYYETWPSVAGPEAAALLELAEPWRELARTANVVDKPTFSKWGQELGALAGEGEEVVLCGVATDCCVLATALAAIDAGRYVRVVRDATAGATPEAQTSALSLLASFAPHIRVSSVADELALAAIGWRSVSHRGVNARIQSG